MKKYSEMSTEELKAEVQRLLGEMRKSEQAGFISEANILEQRYFMAQSYLMGAEHIEVGKQYQVVGETELLTVDYINGVFAWGKLEGTEEARGFPVARLKDVIE